MPVSADFADYVVDQLTGLGAVKPKRMFGGVGLYAHDRFFALISDDSLYLKVGDSNRPDFVARDCKAFQPNPDKPQYSMSYYAVPVDVLEDAEELVNWARRSVAIASPAASPPIKRTRKRRV